MATQGRGGTRVSTRNPGSPLTLLPPPSALVQAFKDAGLTAGEGGRGGSTTGATTPQVPPLPPPLPQTPGKQAEFSSTVQRPAFDSSGNGAKGDSSSLAHASLDADTVQARREHASKDRGSASSGSVAADNASSSAAPSTRQPIPGTLYKTVLCRNFSHTGSCPFGAR